MTKIPGSGYIAVLTEHFADIFDAMGNRGVFTLWVLGGDAKLRVDLIKTLPHSTTLGVLGTRLDVAADRVERDLLDLDQQVLVRKDDRQAWSASCISDRSPYAGNLQLNAARYLILDDIIRAGGQHLFFVEDEQTAVALNTTAKANGLDLSLLGGRITLPKCMGALRARASALKTYWRQLCELKKLRCTHPVPWGKMAECDVLLIDWVGSNSFKDKCETKRVGNLARMPDVLRNAGFKVGFIANPLDWLQPFGVIAANAVNAYDPVVLLNECRTIGSVVRGAWATWRMNQRLKPQFLAADRDLSPLFAMERSNDVKHSQSTLAYTFVDVAKMLALKGVRPKAIVYPFENQGWERALVNGVRRYLPDTRLIAYQHAPFAARYISFFPAQSDIDAGRLPDHLVVMGEHYLDAFRNHGWPEDRLVLGGSLRFEAALNNPPKPAEGDRKTLLAVTSIDFDEATDLVIKAGNAVKDIEDTHMVVNFHPVVDQAFRDGIRHALVMALGESIMDLVEFSMERAIDLIGRADVLLYNSSGAVFDAYFAGVPAVYVAVTGRVSYDKVPGDGSRRATGDEDLKAMIMEILAFARSGEPDMSIGGTIAPVNENAIVKAVMG